MKVLSDVSRYKLFLIGLYAAIFPIFVIYKPDVLNYGIATSHLGSVLAITAVFLLVFYALNLKFKVRKIAWQKLSLLQASLIFIYSASFAIPEEIIFRGLIQGAVQNVFNSTILIVLISSIIFGLAHLPNGSRGFRVKDWNWQFCAITFVAGIPLGIVFVETNNLFAPTLLHSLFLILYMMFTEDYYANPIGRGSGI